MDYTKIYKVISKHHKVYILNHGESQWLSNGFVTYNIDGLPKLDRDNVLPLIGVDSNTAATYNVIMNELPDPDIIMADQLKGDGMLELSKLTVDGFAMLRGNGSNAPDCVFCSAVWLKPFTDDPDITFTFRKINAERSLIIAKCGMLVMGAVTPYKFNSNNKKAAILLEDMTKACIEMARQFEESKNRNMNESEQMGFDDMGGITRA